MFDTLIIGGTIVNANGRREATVAIRDGRIAALLDPGEQAVARDRIEAAGLHLLPGLIDAHVHLREPGLTHKEDFESGTRAAALGGVTTVLDMPTDEPWTATARQLSDKMRMAQGRLHVDVGFQAVVRRSDQDIEALLDLRPVSLEVFTADVPADYMFGHLDALSHVLHRLAGRGIVVGVSPGDQSILEGSAGRHAEGNIEAFLASRPPLAEAGGVARAILAAAETGARVHIRQINSKLGLDTWRGLRNLADVSVETTPQNLYFSQDDYVAMGANLKGSPPLRKRSDVEALRTAMRDGLIDIMATDHAPHAAAEKAARYPAFADIPGGMPGLQTLLPMMLDLVHEKVIDLEGLVRMGSTNPAERFGLGGSKGTIAAGMDADILAVDLWGTTTISDAQQASRAGYTPFDGRMVPGSLQDVFLRGEHIVRKGILMRSRRGRVVRHGG